MKPRTELAPDNVEDVPVEPGTVSDPELSASAPGLAGSAAQDADAPSAAPSNPPASSLWRSRPNCWHSMHMGLLPLLGLLCHRGEACQRNLSLALKWASKL